MPGFSATGIRIAREAAWAPVAVLALHVAFRLSGVYPWWLDEVMHFFGGVAIAFCISRLLPIARPLLGPLSPPASALLVLGLSALAAVGWEFGEFVSDRWFGTALQVGLTDTLSDLLFGLIGAGLWALTVAAAGR